MRRGSCLALGVAVLALAGASTAGAQAGLEVQAGGGLADYNRGLAADTGVGPAWTAGLSINPFPVLGVELTYLGSRVEYGDAGAIRQNGGNAAVRLNLSPGLVTPFVFGGLGLSRISSDAAVPLADNTVLDVPAGAGIQLNLTDRFSVSGRFRYNFIFDDDFERVREEPSLADPERQSFDRWTATVNLGAKL